MRAALRVSEISKTFQPRNINPTGQPRAPCAAKCASAGAGLRHRHRRGKRPGRARALCAPGEEKKSLAAVRGGLAIPALAAQTLHPLHSTTLKTLNRPPPPTKKKRPPRVPTTCKSLPRSSALPLILTHPFLSKPAHTQRPKPPLQPLHCRWQHMPTTCESSPRSSAQPPARAPFWSCRTRACSYPQCPGSDPPWTGARWGNCCGGARLRVARWVATSRTHEASPRPCTLAFCMSSPIEQCARCRMLQTPLIID